MSDAIQIPCVHWSLTAAARVPRPVLTDGQRIDIAIAQLTSH
ncbi:MAG: hypothetical protein ACYTGL_09820 [Planctomycetota bacterium]